MPTYRLHYFPESRNSYKLALMLTLCRETFEPVWTELRGGGARTSTPDISMMAYLHYPTDQSGDDFAASHPAARAWLVRMAKLPGWQSACELLPGRRFTLSARDAGPPSRG